MKDDWLTIPEASKYEINSELVCRNKLTGETLTPTFHQRREIFLLHLYIRKRVRIARTPEEFRLLAEGKSIPTQFVPIPSVGGKYEISPRGTVRNATTKHVLKLHNGSVYMPFNGERVGRSINSLLLEVFDFVKKKTPLRVPVTLERNGRMIYFDSLRQAAFYLAKQSHFSTKYLQKIVSKQKKFDGWRITRLDNGKNPKAWELNAEGRRNKKNYGA